jgi:catechol-2,3-dioxygenase
MPILRIEKIVYGVEDIGTCARFFEDVGLEPVRADPAEAVLRTPANQLVVLRKADDPGLPKAPAVGPGIREIVWGVDSESGLSAIRSELAQDREVSVDSGGTVHSCDVTGYGIGFAVAQIATPAREIKPVNSPGRVERYNEGVKTYGRARPTRLIHVAMDIPAAGHEAANDFYTERLGFKAIDRPLPMGTFMQCEGDVEHHNFLLCHRTNRISTNHVALEVLRRSRRGRQLSCRARLEGVAPAGPP